MKQRIRNLNVPAAIVLLAGLAAVIAPAWCRGAATDLREVIAGADAAQRSISLKAGNWAIASDLEVPGNIALKLAPGATISVAAGKTLTLHGPLDAPLAPVFMGTSSVVFDTHDPQRVYPQWWGAQGDGRTDDSHAFQAAINAFSARGGELFVPDGTYIVGSVGIKSNITVRGNGSASILKQKKLTTYCISTNPAYGKALPVDPAPHNIKFINITFRGTVDTDGFSEFIRLLDIAGSSNIHISKCNFIGFRGDGILLGETRISDRERHNSKITISACIFDGVNKDNRNGISVIDGDDINIEKCSFKNCTRPKMPGAIDFEPDSTYNVIRNIRITDNRFENIGGFGDIIITIEPRVRKLDTTVENIHIEGNIIDGGGGQTGIYVGQQQFADSNTPPNKVIIRKNIVRNTDKPFWILGIRKVRIAENVFEESLTAPLIGYYPDPVGIINVREVEITGNTFKNLSKTDGWGVSVYNAYDIAFRDNTFDNVGKSDGTLGNAIYFRAGSPGTDHVIIENNVFKGRNTTVAVQKETGSVTGPEHNSITGNTFGESDKVFLPVSKH